MSHTRRVGAWGIVGLALALAGCAGQPAAPISHGPYPSAKGYILGRPYEVGGVWYYPHLSPHYSKTGIASWYGVPFNGRLTSDGEIYDENALTAASPTLPLPSYVRVTDLQNGRSVVLRVNDRGPFVNGRILDVTRRAAQLLGFEEAGTAEVRVQAVPGPDGSPIPGTAGSLVAARQSPPSAAVASAAPVAQSSAVTAAPLPPAAARAARPRQMAALAPAPVRAADPPPAAASASPPAGYLGGHWIAPNADLAATFRQEPVQATHIFIQAGAFTNYGNASELRRRLSRIGTVQVTEVTVHGTRFYRVRLGPIRTVDRADQILQKLIGIGQTNARIVVD